jgi:hypothetical protein
VNNQSPEDFLDQHGIILPPTRPRPNGHDRRNGDPLPVFTPTPFVWRHPSTIKPRPFVYDKHLIRGSVSVTAAPGGLGKSSLEIAEAVAMTAMRDLLEIKPAKQMKPLRCWYINFDDKREEIERRIIATCLHFGIKESDIGGRLFYEGRETKLVIAEQNGKNVKIIKPVEKALIAALKAAQIDVLRLDPFVSTHHVEENNNPAIDLVVKTFGDIAEKVNCAINLVHHTRKTGGAEITAEDARGGSSLGAAGRSVRVLNRMTKDEAQKAGISEENHRLYFRVERDKTNFTPPSKAVWRKLESVFLDNGTEDDEGDNVGVVIPWQWPDPFEGVTTSDLRKVQAAIAEGQWRESSQATDWAGHAVAKVLGLNVSRKEDKARISAMLKTWIANGALVVVSKMDEKQRKERPFIEAGQRGND